jgi:uncharacterized protein (DUF1501 family)
MQSKARDTSRTGCSGFRSLLAKRLNRRQAVQAGVIGALGLTLGDFFRHQAHAAADGKPSVAPAQSVIHINLPGGLAQQESWDPKPEAPAEYRGPFGVVKTKLTGEVFSENLPRLAQMADKFTVVRSVFGKVPDHGLATYHLFTGYTPSTVIDYPQMGVVVSRQFGPRKDLPPYVAVPSLNGFSGGSGYMSTKYGAFELGADPVAEHFKVRDFTLPAGIKDEHFHRRQAARNTIESHLRAMDAGRDKLDTMDEFYSRAYKLIASPEARRAFSLDDEPASMTEMYGTYTDPKTRQPLPIGRRLMMARRLVEAGVRFVTVTYGAFDSHVRIKDDCQTFLPALDHAVSALLTDLEQRGLLDSTLVMVTTEFGRTPKVNGTDGRDHWARVYSLMLAGGGIARGQIYGASDATAAEPARDAVALEDFLFTVYHQLGIDASERLMAPGDRPIDIIRGGKLVQGLIA